MTRAAFGRFLESINFQFHTKIEQPHSKIAQSLGMHPQK